MPGLCDTDFNLVLKVLEEARQLGFLGPGDVTRHVQRALDFAVALDDPPGHALDLGSGGGVPGLPLALLWAETRFVLLDGSITRARFLTKAVDTLSLSSRVTVIAERAEVAGRGPSRGRFDLVVSRSLGAPPVTAECAAPFLRVGGRLVIAEPPGGNADRWPPHGLALLGMRPLRAVIEPSALQVLEQTSLCPPEFPRRTGVPSKRPLF